MTQSLTARPTPVRNPNLSSQDEMTRRAWWLIVLNVLMPGTAQIVAGHRRLGRFGLIFTWLLWVAAIVAFAVVVGSRSTLDSLAIDPVVLTVVQVVLVFYAILWMLLTLDTLRLTRLVRIGPLARFGVVVLALAVMVACSGFAVRGAVLAGLAKSTIGTVFHSAKAPVAPIDGRYNVLVLGGDAGPDRVGLRPDSISVASIDAATGATTMIGVPRNMQKVPFVKGSPMWGPFPQGYNCGDVCLINALYTYAEAHPSLYPNAKADDSSPGIEATKDAVEGVLGITIQYYVLVDMQGFSDLIDALGGITLDVTERLPVGGQINAQGQPINVDEWITPGVRHMNGATAQWYARSRHGTSDYDRMARQRQVESAMLAQFTPSVVLTKFEAISKAGEQIVTTDIPTSMLPTFVSLGDKARKLKMSQLELVPPTVFEPDPNFAQIRQLVSNALETSKAPSTATPKP